MDEHIKREAAIRVICDCCAVCADIECCDYAKGSYGGCKEIEGLRAIPAADVVPWDWLEKFTEGKRYNYLSDFLIEAKVVFYRELVEEANDDSIN